VGELGNLNTPQRRSQLTLRERLRDSLRYRNTAHVSNFRSEFTHLSNLSLVLNQHPDLMFLSSSPCKFHFAFNNSSFHEGIDLNLAIGEKESPLHLVVSILEAGVEVNVSKHVYFDDWDSIP